MVHTASWQGTHCHPFTIQPVCTTLHYTSLYGSELYCTTLHCIVLHCTKMHWTALNCITEWKRVGLDKRTNIGFFCAAWLFYCFFFNEAIVDLLELDLPTFKTLTFGHQGLTTKKEYMTFLSPLRGRNWGVIFKEFTTYMVTRFNLSLFKCL